MSTERSLIMYLWTLTGYLIILTTRFCILDVTMVLKLVFKKSLSFRSIYQNADEWNYMIAREGVINGWGHMIFIRTGWGYVEDLLHYSLYFCVCLKVCMIKKTVPVFCFAWYHSLTNK